MIVVADASILLKWFVTEMDTPAALAWRERHLNGEVLLAVPDLALYELPNVLYHSKGFTEAEISEAVRLVRDIGVEVIAPTPDVVETAVKVMVARGVSFYDASYVAVADLLGAQFVTADRKLIAKLSGLPGVQLLA